MKRRELMLLLGGLMTAPYALRAEQRAMSVVGDCTLTERVLRRYSKQMGGAARNPSSVEQILN
jgi:hypothetical protein